MAAPVDSLDRGRRAFCVVRRARRARIHCDLASAPCAVPCWRVAWRALARWSIRRGARRAELAWPPLGVHTRAASSPHSRGEAAGPSSVDGLGEAWATPAVSVTRRSSSYRRMGLACRGTLAATENSCSPTRGKYHSPWCAARWTPSSTRRRTSSRRPSARPRPTPRITLRRRLGLVSSGSPTLREQAASVVIGRGERRRRAPVDRPAGDRVLSASEEGRVRCRSFPRRCRTPRSGP